MRIKLPIFAFKGAAILNAVSRSISSWLEKSVATLVVARVMVAHSKEMGWGDRYLSSENLRLIGRAGGYCLAANQVGAGYLSNKK
jgi:hypothetical protein